MGPDPPGFGCSPVTSCVTLAGPPSRYLKGRTPQPAFPLSPSPLTHAPLPFPCRSLHWPSHVQPTPTPPWSAWRARAPLSLLSSTSRPLCEAACLSLPLLQVDVSIHSSEQPPELLQPPSRAAPRLLASWPLFPMPCLNPAPTPSADPSSTPTPSALAVALETAPSAICFTSPI